MAEVIRSCEALGSAIISMEAPRKEYVGEFSEMLRLCNNRPITTRILFIYLKCWCNMAHPYCTLFLF